MTHAAPLSAAALLALMLALVPAHAQESASETTAPPPVATAPPPLAASAAPADHSPRPAPLPSVSLDYGTFAGSLDRAVVQGGTLTYGGELTLRAGMLQGDLLHQQYDATGGVRVHEADTTLVGSSLSLSGAQGAGRALDARLTQKPYTVRAAQIDLTAASVVAHEASATTAPPEKRSDLDLRAQTISLFPQRHHGEARNASLYLFGERVLTIPRIGFTLGTSSGGNRRQGVLPTVGISGRYGTYLAFGGNNSVAHALPFHYRLVLSTRQQTQVRVTSRQTLFEQSLPAAPPSDTPQPLHPDFLGALRTLATIPRPLLPDGDPLLFHDFLPDRNPIRLFDGQARTSLSLGEEVSTHQEAIGRRHDNIYVSRLPEAILSATLPLSPALPAPALSDPDAFRRQLRQVRLVAFAQAGLGEYREERRGGRANNVQTSRQRDVLGLTTQPFLVGSNTVLLPQVQLTSNFYGGARRAYKFAQLSVAASHYFSQTDAIGVRYLQSGESGDSPFDFDHLDTTRELDIRAQTGSARRSVAGLVRYDLARGGVIDYKLAVAVGLEGITPVLSYNFRSRSIGLGVEIVGVTF